MMEVASLAVLASPFRRRGAVGTLEEGMIVNERPLLHAMESAQLRLDNLRQSADLERQGITSARVDLRHEVGAIYNLLMEIGRAVNELQKENNKCFGG